ncbi:MAG: tripartite tricarboxylate transporter permease [Spirochaetales bacterium]|nr:tripartite tricarboxylate transporter permease [Spirochaetales bacterium]
MFDLLGQGFLHIFMQPVNILLIFVGVGVGIILGSMPGLTATMGIAIALPLTFGMQPESGLILLSSIFIGGIHGGGIPGILIKTPGTPASAASMIDGFELSKQGKASLALGVHAFSSATGSFFATILLIFGSTMIAKFAINFGPAEFFLLSLMGLSVVSSVTGKSTVKGLMMASFGLLLSTVGMDPIKGVSRFTFGTYQLMDGFNLVPALIGLFAISQVLTELEQVHVPIVKAERVKVNLPDRKTILRLMPTILKSSVLGTLIGAIPGPGAILGSFIPYAEAKRVSKHPEKFGRGALEGVSAAEAGNNSAAIGALIPTLTLGIPGEAATAVLLGGLMILGLRPGPMLFIENADVVYSLFTAILLGAVVLLILGLIMAQYIGKIIILPKKFLLPVVLMLCMIGSYAIRNSVFDMGVALVFGLMGYALNKIDYPTVPILLGLILGPIAESNFRRAMLISKGDIGIFFSSTYCYALIIITVLSLFFGYRLTRNLNRQVQSLGIDDDSKGSDEDRSNSNKK